MEHNPQIESTSNGPENRTATPAAKPTNVATVADPVAAAEDDKGDAGDGSSKLSSVFTGATAFMGLAGKEWLSSLVNQPTEPPFRYDAQFDNEFVRVMRLVVMVVILTGIVVGSERLFVDKGTPKLVISLALKVLIGAFLAAIVYGLFAFACGVRVWEEKRKNLTRGQIFFSILYIFVPWLPILAFLWIVAAAGGTLRLLALTLLLYLCVGYMVLNFAKAVRRVAGCPFYRVWLSVLLPIVLVLGYVLFRT
ncbi:MAG: hypothetical protein QOI77_1412 [Blastocatellia bacterium]|jgi:hypothetical protein|nr:hypothetical protein [Blastocatellia bacterium]